MGIAIAISIFLLKIFFGGTIMPKVNTEMKKILFANTRKIIIEEGSLPAPNNVALALTVNKKLEQYNMCLDASAIRALSTQTANEMSATWQEMEKIIRDVSGANDFNGPLFYANFPEEVMAHTDAELYLNSLFYYSFAQTNDKLSIAIANELQAMMSESKRNRLPLLEQFPRDLTIINKGTEQDLFKMMDARMHSLNMSEQQFEELKRFSFVYKNEFNKMLESETPFQSKETKVKIAMMLHHERRDKEIAFLLKDSVDVLRFAAILSKENGMEKNNVELKPIKDISFKLHANEKRLIRYLLNNCSGLYADIWRQKELFQRLMNRLGTTKESGCPERVVKAFDNLANKKKLDEHGNPIVNTEREVELAIEHLNKTGDNTKLEKIASERAGEFRRIYISAVAKTKEEYRHFTINAIRHCALSDSIPVKDLLTIREQLSMAREANELMANGTPKAKIYAHSGDKRFVTTDRGVNLTNKNIEDMRELLMNTASTMVDGYQHLGKVYLDDDLKNVKAPGREMRGASGGSVLTPYSSIETNEDKNLLIFGIRWEKTEKGHDGDWLDVDLSVHMYDKDYNDKGHVSYSNLRSFSAVHSGDFTHVHECGHSTEAIVADKSRLKLQGIKYLVAEVHCFSIPSFRDAGNCRFVYEQREGSFDEFNKRNPANAKNAYLGHDPKLAGQSEGNPVFMGEVFEPSTLENCITLNSDGTSTIPLVYDVENEKILWLDMTLNNGHRAMPRNTENPLIMTSVMAEIERAQHNPYPSVKDLIECYAKHNGEFTDNIQEADTVFTRYNIDAEELGLKENARIITGFDVDVISKEFSGNDDQSMIVKEEPKQEEKAYVEPPLVRQFKYFHQKLQEFPRGQQIGESLNLDDVEIEL